MDALADYFVLLFLVLLIIYNVSLTQILPKSVQQILRNPVVKVLTLLLIFVFALNYPTVALLLLVAYILSHSYSQTSGSSDNIVSLTTEHYTNEQEQ